MFRYADGNDFDAVAAPLPWVQRPWLIVRIWHWRHVPLLGGVVPAALVELGVNVDPAVPATVVASLLASVAVTPELRRWLMTRMRCLVVPHSIRQTFEDGLICSPDGRPPVIVWTSALPGGVRVRLRCPLGMRTQEIEKAADLLQAACHADEVVIVREPNSRTVIVGLRYAPGRRPQWWPR